MEETQTLEQSSTEDIAEARIIDIGMIGSRAEGKRTAISSLLADNLGQISLTLKTQTALEDKTWAELTPQELELLECILESSTESLHELNVHADDALQSLDSINSDLKELKEAYARFFQETAA